MATIPPAAPEGSESEMDDQGNIKSADATDEIRDQETAFAGMIAITGGLAPVTSATLDQIANVLGFPLASDSAALIENLKGKIETRELFLAGMMSIKDSAQAREHTEILEEIQAGNYSRTFKLRYLTDETAELLGKHHEGILYLSALIGLSRNAAEFLGHHRGPLELGGLIGIDDKDAEFLANNEGDLWLDGVLNLTDTSAEYLGKYHKGALGLNGLTNISDKAAEFLSAHQGPILLTGLTNISDVAAEYLSKHRDGELLLAQSVTMSEKAAEQLKFNPEIYFVSK